jgi:2-polyprenyl-6-methoxyphenol hydroxylase-like FAD-dependent oxidoreductase
MNCPRALVIGGSVGGLFAAHLLRQAGWSASVFERSANDLADRGASIGTQPDLFAVMQRIGITLDPAMSIAIDGRICLDGAGALLHQLPIRSFSSAWDRIYRPLRDTWPARDYHAGFRLAQVQQDEHRVTAIFANGARESGDLLIAADGIHSAVRAQLMPQIKPRYAGYVAWRGVIEESALTQDEHALLFGRMSFCFPPGSLFLSLAMPGRAADLRPGRRRYYWIWFRPVEESHALPRLCTDREGRCHGSSIPPQLIRLEVVRELHDAAAALAPSLAAIVRRTSHPFPHGIFDVESARLVLGRVALLGDAAFVARPHIGAGITKAALDAACLGDCVTQSGDLEDALTRYDQERGVSGRGLVARARHLGAYVDGRLERHPEIVLAEYGAAGKVG